MAIHNETGKNGEDTAADFLKSLGYEIIERNWYSSHREIDIIAKDNDWLVFVEVKTRSGEVLLNPEEAVNKKKMRFMVNAAHHFIKHFNHDNPVRFDVVSVIFGKNGTEINHFKDAFLALNAI